MDHWLRWKMPSIVAKENLLILTTYFTCYDFRSIKKYYNYFQKKCYERLAIKLNGPLTTSKTCWSTLKIFVNDTKIISYATVNFTPSSVPGKYKFWESKNAFYFWNFQHRYCQVYQVVGPEQGSWSWRNINFYVKIVCYFSI